MRTAFVNFFILLACFTPVGSISASDILFNLDYSTLSVLPSATGQGLRFVSGSYLGQTESQGFQVYPGYLHINTPNGYSLNKGAVYQLDNGYDHNLDLVYKFTAKVDSGTQGALQFGFGDSAYSGYVGFNNGSFEIPGYANNLNFNVDPSQYHTYEIQSLANSGTFSLKIDGNQVFTGNLASGGATSYAYFGSPYTYGYSGFVSGDITYVDYKNQNITVPEPSTWLMGLAALMLITARRWRASISTTGHFARLPKVTGLKPAVLTLLFALCAFAHPSFSADLLMLGADQPDRIDFMKARVLNGATIGGFSFDKVDTIDAKVGAAASLATMKQYFAILLWGPSDFADYTSLGNNLADYVDAGGNVVVMTYGNPYMPSGRWYSGGYDPTHSGGPAQKFVSLGTIHDPTNPIFAGVNSISVNSISNVSVRTGATLLASWNIDAFGLGSQTPMVVESNGLAGKVVALNFYVGLPTNTNNTGDIDRLIANTLNVLTVPEPSTWLMGLVAAGLLGASNRRKSMIPQRRACSNQRAITRA